MLINFFEKIDSLPIVKLLYITAIIHLIMTLGNLWIDASVMSQANPQGMYQGNTVTNSHLMIGIFARLATSLSSCLYQIMLLIGLAEIIKIKQKKNREAAIESN